MMKGKMIRLALSTMVVAFLSLFPVQAAGPTVQTDGASGSGIQIPVQTPVEPLPVPDAAAMERAIREAISSVNATEGTSLNLVEEGPGGCVQRTIITDKIAHYFFKVRVGPGTYDVIGIHRVVRKKGSNQPIDTPKNVFLLHGDYKDFEGCFLPGVSHQNLRRFWPCCLSCA